MKKFSLCLAALLAFSGQALAHGGGLDAYGGHHNRKQGNYHFHRGPLAGQTFAGKAEALDALNKTTARTSTNSRAHEKQPEKSRAQER